MTQPEKIQLGNRTEYHLNGKLHREDGPAIEHSNGCKEWWLNGELHREDGPAVEHSNGCKEWWLNSERHREDGPAIEYSNGGKEWWLNGRKVTEPLIFIDEAHAIADEDTLKAIYQMTNNPQKENPMNQKAFGVIVIGVGGKHQYAAAVYCPNDAASPIYVSPRGKYGTAKKLATILEKALQSFLENYTHDDILRLIQTKDDRIESVEQAIQAWVDNWVKKNEEIVSLTQTLEQRVKLHQESLTAQEALQKALHEAENSKRIKIGELCEGIIFRFPKGAESTHYKIVNNTRGDGQIEYQHLKNGDRYTSDHDHEVIVVAADAEHFNYVWGDLKAAEKKVKELKKELAESRSCTDVYVDRCAKMEDEIERLAQENQILQITKDDLAAAELTIHELKSDLQTEKANHAHNLKSMREKIDAAKCVSGELDFESWWESNQDEHETVYDTAKAAFKMSAKAMDSTMAKLEAQNRGLYRIIEDNLVSLDAAQIGIKHGLRKLGLRKKMVPAHTLRPGDEVEYNNKVYKVLGLTEGGLAVENHEGAQVLGTPHGQFTKLL